MMQCFPSEAVSDPARRRALPTCRCSAGSLLLACLLALSMPGAVQAQSGNFSLHYAPRVIPQALQYPLKLGVPDAHDRRFQPFHLTSDALLREPVGQAIGDITFVELRASGLFAEVRRIKEVPPEDADAAALTEFKRRHGVDLLMLTDVSDLNMRREKEDLAALNDVTRITPEFKIVIDAAWTARLVFPDQGVIVWGDLVEGQAVELAREGTLPPEQLGVLTRQAISSGMNDMRTLLARFGKRMAR